jgi:hypothetical protein
MGQGCLLSSLLLNSLWILYQSNKTGEEIQGIQIGKEEVKLSLFAYDMILYLKNLKNSTKKLQDTINTFRKIAEYKINS